jgi:hypothetical protein
MIVREIYSEIGKDGTRITGERFVEMPGVLTEEEAAPENAKRANADNAQKLQAATLADVIDAVTGDVAAIERVRVAALEIRRLRDASLIIRDDSSLRTIKKIS